MVAIIVKGNFLLGATIWATVWCQKNSKWQRVGYSKAKIGGIHIHFFDILKRFSTC